MNVLIVVNQRRDWPGEVPSGMSVISAREYLTDAAGETQAARVS